MSTSAHDRSPATAEALRYFEYAHLPPHLQAISRPCHFLAHAMVDALPDGAQLSVGLQKLIEAKDAFVRAGLPPAAPAAAGRPSPADTDWIRMEAIDAR